MESTDTFAVWNGQAWQEVPMTADQIEWRDELSSYELTCLDCEICRKGPKRQKSKLFKGYMAYQTMGASVLLEKRKQRALDAAGACGLCGDPTTEHKTGAKQESVACTRVGFGQRAAAALMIWGVQCGHRVDRRARYQTILEGGRYSLFVTESAVSVLPASPDRVPLLHLRLEELDAFQVGGPGRQTSGGRFVGGGFGAAGAAEGMVVAGVLNALTRKTTVTTFVTIEASDLELMFVCRSLTPDQLTNTLRPVFMRHEKLLAERPSALPPPSSQPVSTASGDLATQLAQVASLHEAGALSHEEFQAVKAKLLGR